MAKISYTDKVSLAPSGSPDANTWRDNDANEVKTVVNSNDTVTTSASNTVAFDKIQGYRHGSWVTPIVGTIILNTSGAVEGGCAVVIWNGSESPTFSGGTIQSYSGNVTESGTYSVYLHYLNGRFNVNVFNVEGYAPVSSYQYLLDEYPSARVAYGLMTLSSSATRIAQVRRSSDNDEQIISTPTSGWITLSTPLEAGSDLGTWAGSDDVFVKTLYDQTANNDNPTQATQSKQLQLMSAGAFITLNGNPAMRSLQSTLSHLTKDTLGSEIDDEVISSFVVGATNDTSKSSFYSLVSTNSNDRHQLGWQLTNNRFGTYWLAGNHSIESVATQDAQTLITGINRGLSSREAWVNGTSIGSDTTTMALGTAFRYINIGKTRNSDELIGDAQYQLAVTYSSDKSADRAAIESIINSYL